MITEPFYPQTEQPQTYFIPPELFNFLLFISLRPQSPKFLNPQTIYYQGLWKRSKLYSITIYHHGMRSCEKCYFRWEVWKIILNHWSFLIKYPPMNCGLKGNWSGASHPNVRPFLIQRLITTSTLLTKFGTSHWNPTVITQSYHVFY